MTATRLPVETSARLGLDPAHLPGLVGDGLLDGLDGDRLVLEVERAGLLARSRADAAGEFREVVGGVEVARGLLPVVLDQTRSFQSGIWLCTGQPVGPWQKGMPQSMQRAACLLQVVVVERQRELAEVADAFAGELILLLLPVVFEKACDLAHGFAP